MLIGLQIFNLSLWGDSEKKHYDQIHFLSIQKIDDHLRQTFFLNLSL